MAVQVFISARIHSVCTFPGAMGTATPIVATSTAITGTTATDRAIGTGTAGVIMGITAIGAIAVMGIMAAGPTTITATGMAMGGIIVTVGLAIRYINMAIITVIAPRSAAPCAMIGMATVMSFAAAAM